VRRGFDFVILSPLKKLCDQMKVGVRTTRKHKRLRKNLLNNDLDTTSFISEVHFLSFIFILWLIGLVKIPIREDG